KYHRRPLGRARGSEEVGSWASRQVVPFPKVAVKLIKRNAAVPLSHVIKSFLNRGDIFVKCSRLRMQPSPFIQSFFWGQVDSVGTELAGEKAVKLAKFFDHCGRHEFPPLP